MILEKIKHNFYMWSAKAKKGMYACHVLKDPLLVAYTKERCRQRVDRRWCHLVAKLNVFVGESLR